MKEKEKKQNVFALVEPILVDMMNDKKYHY